MDPVDQSGWPIESAAFPHHVRSDPRAGRVVTAAAAKAEPTSFLGRPLAHWLFGLRTWLGMVLALYVAFWLQLDGASSAAVCVAILALPNRGQAISKAFWRFAGTALGVVASVAIAGLFNETRTLFLVAVAGWIALCVFVANLVDGNRAYGAVLSGYTVAIVAVADIDDPTRTFSSGIDRGAAIAIGIVVVALVNDLFGAPDVLPGLLGRVEAAHGEVRAFALRVLGRGTADPDEVVRLMGRITALRADALLLPAESVAGGARAAAARRALAELVREARAARVLAGTLAVAGEDGAAWRARIAAALDDREEAEHLLDGAARTIAAEGVAPRRLIAARGVEAVVKRDRVVAASIGEMASGRGSTRAPGLPVYHSRRSAARNALRIFIILLVGSACFVMSGWPTTSTAMLQLGALAGISATNPNPWGFAVGAVIAMPLAVAAAGVTEFLVLDGADAYPLLAMALLPTVLAGCLLVAAGKPALFGVGFLLIVYTPVLLSLANPQSYNPQTYLTSSLLSVIAAFFLAASLATVLPTDDARRRRWILTAARREFLAAVRGRRIGRLGDAEASFRAADRLAQLSALAYADDRARTATLAYALHLAEVTFSARWVRESLRGLDGALAGETLAALAALDPARLRAAGSALCGDARGRWAGANAARTAALIERHAGDVALARAGGLP